MVAYSFKRHFADKIRSGTKAQTIRAERNRHARAGEPLQLYIGMRTRQCQLVGTAICKAVSPVRLDLDTGAITIGAQPPITRRKALDKFAVSDGFDNFQQMRDFWRATHDATGPWDGILIEWHQFKPGPKP